jgi:O-antigen/teichoic acid export membrane protein
MVLPSAISASPSTNRRRQAFSGNQNRKMKNRFLRNSAFGAMAGLSGTLGSFLSGLIVARMLGVEKTGIVSVAIWGAAMAAALANAGIPFTLSRFMPELTAKGEVRQANELAANLFWPYLVFAVLPALGFLGYAGWQFVHPVARVSSPVQPFKEPTICIILACFCVAQALSDYCRGYLKGAQRFHTIALFTVSSMVIQLVAITVGAYFFGYEGAISGYLSGNLLLAVSVLQVVRRPTAIAGDLKSRVIRYSAYRWAAEIAAVFVWSRIELFFLQSWWGSEAVGLFTIGLTLSNLAVQGPLMLTWGLLPRFAEQFGRRETDQLQQGFATATRIMAFLVFPACFGLAAVMPEFLPLIFGQPFAKAVPLAQVLVCGAAFTATTAVGGNLLLAMERSDVDFYSGILGAILIGFSGFFIISTYGPIGAAWSRAISQTVVVSFGCYMVGGMGFILPFRELLRLFAAALICAVTARTVSMVAPGVVGLALAIALGAAAYFAAVRFLCALTSADISSLRSLAQTLPRPLTRIAEPLLRFISGRELTCP